MHCSTPGCSVLHQLPGFTQTHIHRVSDAILPSHPLSSPFPPAQEINSFIYLFFLLDCVLLECRVCEKYFSSVQFSHSVVSDSLRPHESQHARPASLSTTNSQSSLRLKSIESVMPSCHLILCHPLLLLPPIPPSISLLQ